VNFLEIFGYSATYKVKLIVKKVASQRYLTLMPGMPRTMHGKQRFLYIQIPSGGRLERSVLGAHSEIHTMNILRYCVAPRLACITLGTYSRKLSGNIWLQRHLQS